VTVSSLSLFPPDPTTAIADVFEDVKKGVLLSKYKIELKKCYEKEKGNKNYGPTSSQAFPFVGMSKS
jgi:hypothetical protein